jgi:hypothetical protein
MRPWRIWEKEEEEELELSYRHFADAEDGASTPRCGFSFISGSLLH